VSDASVRTALRSDARLVVIEAPAGCGKTYQGADYVGDLAASAPADRTLIVTHTHAACSVVAERTRGLSSRVQIRTIDSVIGEVASAYHAGLGVSADTGTWARQRSDGYGELATKVARLLARYPMIGRSLATRYPVVICDEHQDSSGDPPAIVMALHGQGSRLRLFADPMQRIFREKRLVGGNAAYSWEQLTKDADAFEELDHPHRWASGCSELGQWTLKARAALKAGSQVDLRDVPASVEVVFAENIAQKRLDFRLSIERRRAVDAFEKRQSSLLVLTHHNDTARAMRSFFFRKIPLWEGYTRNALELLVDHIQANSSPEAIAAGMVTFLGSVAKGFSPSALGDRFEQEALERCEKKARGKPASIQELARLIIAEPNHLGVSKALNRLAHFIETEPVFADVKLDCHREFWDAVRLGEYESTDFGLAELAHRRTYSRPKPPPRAVSTIHKAKGLECESVILAPCDASTFPEKPETRCLLYVALSRAKSNLMMVVSRDNPSPLLIF
jgi:UvrD-like helicase C-terminal domain/AAA domain